MTTTDECLDALSPLTIAEQVNVAMGLPHNYGGELWVCAVCLHANVNAEDIRDPQGDDPEPWALWEGGDFELTAGLDWANHYNPGDCEAAFRGGEGCDCEMVEFSTSRCDGCGQHLAGDRHAFTWWTR